eukprot:scaffold26078_cov75-Attheya_sp.AAC.1
MPGGTAKEGNVDAAQGVIDGCDQEGVPGKKESSEGEGRVLGETDLVRGSVEVKEGGAGNHPLGHGGPKVDGKGSGVGRGHLGDDAHVGIGEGGAQKGSPGHDTGARHSGHGRCLHHVLDLFFPVRSGHFVFQSPP